MLLSMDAHSIRRDTGITGDRDKRSEWVERDETMDHRSTSHNTIASASRRIVCLALISGPDLSNSFSPTSVLSSSSSSFLRDHLFRVCSIVDTRRLEGSPIFPFLSLPLPLPFHLLLVRNTFTLAVVFEISSWPCRSPLDSSALFFPFSLSLFYSHDTSNERADSDSGTEVSRRKFARKKRSEMEREKRLVNASSRRVRIDNKPR